MEKINLGNNVIIHIFPTEFGKLFSLQEVSQKIFDQTPGSILQEMRVARYVKHQITDEDVLADLETATIPIDGGAVPSATMLPSDTLLALLADKRRPELVQPLQLALLKFSSQEAARAMAHGNFEAALPVTLDAISQAQDLFHHRPVIQMFPLYLLAAQANLGLKRLKQSEDFLSLATHLSVQHADEATHVMLSQLNRLYGQLYVLKNKPSEALQSFAEDLYHCSVEFGPEDVRSALGYYNLAKMFQTLGDLDKCGPCCEATVRIWYRSMNAILLKEGRLSDLSRANDLPTDQLPMTRVQLNEVVAVFEDLRSLLLQTSGATTSQMALLLLTAAMLFVHIGRRQDALERLEDCRAVLSQLQLQRSDGVESAVGAGVEGAGGGVDMSREVLLEKLEKVEKRAKGL